MCVERSGRDLVQVATLTT